MNKVRRVTGRMVVIKGGNILLMERWRGGLHYFSIPGGGVEAGETPGQAAKREIKEETGIEANVGREIYLMETEDSTHHIFIGKYLSGEPMLQPGSPEAAQDPATNRFEPKWVLCDEVGRMPFVYWQPLKPYLLDGLHKGFPSKAIIIHAKPPK